MDEAKIEDLPWILEEGDLEPKNMIFGWVEVVENFLRSGERRKIRMVCVLQEHSSFDLFSFVLFDFLLSNNPYYFAELFVWLISSACHQWQGLKELVVVVNVVTRWWFITLSSLHHAYVISLHHACVIFCILNSFIYCTWWSHIILLLWLGLNP